MTLSSASHSFQSTLLSEPIDYQCHQLQSNHYHTKQKYWTMVLEKTKRNVKYQDLQMTQWDEAPSKPWKNFIHNCMLKLFDWGISSLWLFYLLNNNDNFLKPNMVKINFSPAGQGIRYIFRRQEGKRFITDHDEFKKLSNKSFIQRVIWK